MHSDLPGLYPFFKIFQKTQKSFSLTSKKWSVVRDERVLTIAVDPTGHNYPKTGIYMVDLGFVWQNFAKKFSDFRNFTFLFLPQEKWSVVQNERFLMVKMGSPTLNYPKTVLSRVGFPLGWKNFQFCHWSEPKSKIFFLKKLNFLFVLL